MKWLLTSIALVVAVALWTLREPVVEPSEPLSPANSDGLPSFTETEQEGEPLM